MIPKCDSPKHLKDLRPISLCNVLYKVFAKVLANIMNSIITNIISEAQSSFMSGRAITDNSFEVFEIIHFMKRKNKGKTWDIALKIDINKAYGRIDKGFFEHMLTKLGFNRMWLDLVMMCLKSVQCSVFVNENTVGPIVLQRGLR